MSDSDDTKPVPLVDLAFIAASRREADDTLLHHELRRMRRRQAELEMLHEGLASRVEELGREMAFVKERQAKLDVEFEEFARNIGESVAGMID